LQTTDSNGDTLRVYLCVTSLSKKRQGQVTIKVVIRHKRNEHTPHKLDISLCRP